MLYVNWVTVGDLPNGPYREIVNKLKKPLQGFTKLTHTCVSELRPIHAQNTKGPSILLDAEGELLSSEAFAQKCKDWEAAGEHVTFCLGGPKGVSSNLKKQFGYSLSLSKMTTTHDMAHLFFIEQLYRAMTIVHHRPYHY